MIKEVIDNNKEIQIGDKELDVLKENFPACFKKDGSFDFTRFRKYLNDKLDVVDEGYELKFLGKDYARLVASLDTETVIEPDNEHNNKEENRTSENIYIIGDNLDGLKHLLKSYQNKIDMIYIDPPYNTGKNFSYKDKFEFTSETLSKKLDIDIEEAENIIRFSKKGSSSHSAWLTFMLPRLLLSKHLLKKSGVIFISIDDNEQNNLKTLCDEIFGETNFLAQICWKGRSGKQDSKHYASIHEYIIAYANDIESFKAGEIKKEDDNSYTKYDSTRKKYFKTQLLRKWGSGSRRIDRANLFYPIKAPDGTDVYPLLDHLNEDDLKKFPKSGKEGRWRWKKETMKKALEDDRVLFKKDKSGDWIAYEKIYKPDKDNFKTKKYTTWIDDVGNGTKELKNLFGKSVFSYPKSTQLIKLLIKMANVPEGGYILDFFSGSGTTAHAVLETENNYNFIVIQIPEVLEEMLKLTDEGKEAIENAIELCKSLSKPHWISEIGIERLKRVLKSQPELNKGFKIFKLNDISEETLESLENFDPNVITTIIDKNNLLDEFGPDPILTTWANNDGYGLTKNPEIVDLAGYKATYYRGNEGNGGHLYFIEPGLTPDVIDALLVKYEEEDFNPTTIVLFGYSFGWKELEELERNLARLNKAGNDLKVNLDVRY